MDAQVSSIQLPFKLANPLIFLVVLAHRSQDGWSGDQKTSVHDLNNPDELSRVISEHPDETDAIKDGRVIGFLEPTRGELPQQPMLTSLILSAPSYRRRLAKDTSHICFSSVFEFKTTVDITEEIQGICTTHYNTSLRIKHTGCSTLYS